MKTFELTPVNRKSFYGKCRVEENESIKILYSYNTKVSHYNKETGKIKITKNPKFLTNTTLRHINAFLVYNGLNTMTKKEILNS